MDERQGYDEKLQRILKEASAIFAEKSYHQASVRDISAATGISLSGLYYYFRSKEELLFLIQSHCFDTILERLQQDLDPVQDAETRLKVLIRNHLAFFAGNMAEMKVLSHEDDTLTGAFADQVLAQKKRYVDTVRSIIAEVAPGLSPDELRVATFSLFGMMNWIYTWYRPGRDVDVPRLSQAMHHMFLHGLRAPLPAPVAGADALGGTDPTSIWREPGARSGETRPGPVNEP